MTKQAWKIGRKQQGASRMRSRVRRAFAILASGIAAVAVGSAGAADGGVVRASANGRVWQVNLSPDEPIRWAWAAGAETAHLTISNAVKKTVVETDVTRSPDESFGAFDYSVAADPAEQLCVLSLVQVYRPGTDSAKTVSTERARIAYLPGVHGAPIDVLTAKHLRRCASANVFAYDAAWADAAATTATLTEKSGATESVRTLEGTSGYDVFAFADGATTRTVALAFDETTFASADVRLGTLGLLILIR